MSNVTDAIIVAEALGKTSMIIMVGLYFIFSNTVMQSLRKFHNGAEVMVEINQVILNPLFMSCFVLSGLSALCFAITSSGTIAVSGAIFFAGTTMVTMMKNVPLNNKLRDAENTDILQQVWQEYLSTWLFYNHIRSFSGIVSAFLLVI